MSSSTVVVLDNSLAAQEQDYLPSRFILEKELTNSIITQVLETDAEGHVGIVPLAQQYKNDILTSTRTRAHITSFLDNNDLQRPVDLVLSVFQAEQSLNMKGFTAKKLIIFVCSQTDSIDEAIACLYGVASKGIDTKVICFGDALELGGYLKKEVSFDNFQCLNVQPDQDFISAVNSFLQCDMSSYDPDLQEALRQSMLNQ